MGDPLTLLLILELDPSDDHLRGRLINPVGGQQEFEGWLEFANCVAAIARTESSSVEEPAEPRLHRVGGSVIEPTLQKGTTI